MIIQARNYSQSPDGAFKITRTSTIWKSAVKKTKTNSPNHFNTSIFAHRHFSPNVLFTTSVLEETVAMCKTQEWTKHSHPHQEDHTLKTLQFMGVCVSMVYFPCACIEDRDNTVLAYQCMKSVQHSYTSSHGELWQINSSNGKYLGLVVDWLPC